jgi:hypothetical protein
MKKRNMYWRRKKKAIVLEGSKGEYLFQLPEPNKFILFLDGLLRRENGVNLPSPKHSKIPSIFTKEKWEKIMEKFTRLEIKQSKEDNNP